MSFSLAGKRIWIAGDTGLVGRAIGRRLAREAVTIVAPPHRIDLRDQGATHGWMMANPVDLVFVAAARVGGIAANSARPAAFLYDNLMIEANIIEGARLSGVAKLVCLGSSCIYPKMAPQPIPESALLTGPLEPTNQWYAVAKIAALKLCEAYRAEYGCDFIAVQPTNLYGPHDNYDLSTSHVLPAILRKAHEATLRDEPVLTIWGSGTPLREFLHVDDLADALVFLAERYSDAEPINVGSGDEISIGDLARVIMDVVGYRGTVAFDASRPDGTPRKLVDSGKLHAMGWRPSIALRDGIEQSYAWFRENQREPG